MTLIGAPFMAHFFDHESLWDLITLPRIILREIIRYPHILMFQLRNILSMAMQQDPKKLEVPTIYFWPIFEAYVRGYTLKVWAYMVQYLHFTKMAILGAHFLTYPIWLATSRIMVLTQHLPNIASITMASAIWLFTNKYKIVTMRLIT
jgi:hypothetical protein